MSFTSNYAGGLGSLFLCTSLGSPPFHLASPCCVWFPSCRLSSVCSLCLRLSTLGPEPSRLCVSMSFRCSCPVCSSCASPSLCLLAVPFVLQVYSEFFSFRLFPTWFSVCFLCLAYPLRTESPSISSVRSPPSKDGKWAGYTYIHAHDVQTYTHKVQTDRQTNRQTHIHTYIHTYIHWLCIPRPQVSGGVGCGAAASWNTFGGWRGWTQLGAGASQSPSRGFLWSLFSGTVLEARKATALDMKQSTRADASNVSKPCRGGHTYRQTHVHTYTHTCTHTDRRAYIHTHIRTDKHTYMRACPQT